MINIVYLYYFFILKNVDRDAIYYYKLCYTSVLNFQESRLKYATPNHANFNNSSVIVKDRCQSHIYYPCMCNTCDLY